jgi:hypothetical protein
MNPDVLVGWLDLCEEDQRNARAYLTRMKQEGTLDELGFGILRDAFAEKFFPTTNTIMTRTRYLLFIPALYRKIEEERLSGEQAARRLKSLEDELRVQLEKTGDDGVIGRVAKESLRRYPSSIYWNALRRLGIFFRDWTQGYYQAHLSQFYAAMRPLRDDDGSPHLAGDGQGNWDPEFDGLEVLGKGEKFLRTAQFGLTRAEARYMEGKFAAVGESLLAHLVFHHYTADFNYPWEVPCPPALRGHVEHARFLSMLAKGATLHYYNLLCRAQHAMGRCDAPNLMADAFCRWWSVAHGDLARWGLDEFTGIAAQMKAVRANDLGFFEGWLKACLSAGRGEDLLVDKHAETMIRHRESIKRQHKARLSHSDYLRNWKPPNPTDGLFADERHVPYWLDFRSPIGGTVVREIVSGLKGKADV